MIKNKKIFITSINSSISKKLIFFVKKKFPNSIIYVLSNSKIKKKKNNNIFKVFKSKDYFSNIIKYKKIINNCDFFFHLSYQNSELFAKNNVLEDFKINVLGLKNILEQIKNNKKLIFIFLSTVSLYKSSKNKINEKSKINILSFYNLHKLYCENLIKFYSKFSKNRFIILRLSNVYGDDDLSKRDFLLNCLIKVKKKIQVNIYGSGNYLRDFIHINDVALALIKIIETKIKDKINIYNLCSGTSISIKILVRLITKEFKRLSSDYNPKIKYIKNFDELAKRNFLCNPIKFKKKFKWKPKIKLTKGIKELSLRIL